MGFPVRRGSERLIEIPPEEEPLTFPPDAEPVPVPEEVPA